MESVAWGWPVGMLAAGLLIGLAFLWRLRGGAPEPAAAQAPIPLELRDLDGRLEALLGQLRELEDLAHKRSPEQMARERYALELEAAAALRARESGAAQLPGPAKKAKGPAAAAPAAATGFLATRPGLRGFLWGTVTAASVGALVFVVWRQAKPREEGGSLTGNLPNEGRRPAPNGAMADDEMAQLTAAVARNPEDLETRLDLAQLHLRQRDLMGVWNETQYVLARQPGQPRALSYQALVRLAMGQPDAATSMLKQALATDPDLIEGYLHLALVHMRTGRMKDAEGVIEQASKRFPAQAPMFARVLAEMRTAASQAPAGAEGDPHADVPAPGTESADAEPAPAAGPGLAGVIELPDALRSRVSPGALVFVTVRDASATEGPPVAVKRLAAASFPIAFAVGPADSMMGQPLPARARVEARVDSDGDPLTRVPTDPSARLDGVAAGSMRLRLVLQ